MADALIDFRKLLGVATETTKGTAASVTAALSAQVVYNLIMEPGDIFSDGTRRPNTGHSGELTPTEGPRVGTCTFTTDLSYQDSFMTLVTACGFEVSSGVATPTADQSKHETLTLVCWEGGRKKTLFGSSGTFTIRADGASQRIQVDWVFTGIFTTVADEAMPSDPSSLVKGWRNESATMTLASTALPPIDGFTLAVNADVQPREDNTTGTGLSHYIVADVLPTLTIQPEAAKVATYDQYGKFFAGTAEALVMSFEDANDNTFAITAPKFQRTQVADQARNRKLVDALTGGLYVDSGNDQVKFTETAAA